MLFIHVKHAFGSKTDIYDLSIIVYTHLHFFSKYLTYSTVFNPDISKLNANKGCDNMNRNNLFKSILLVATIIMVVVNTEVSSITFNQGRQYQYYNTFFEDNLMICAFFSYPNELTYSDSRINVICIDKNTMKTLWKDDFNQIQVGKPDSPFAHNHILVMNSQVFGYDVKGGYVKCLDIKTGKKLWQYKLIKNIQNGNVFNMFATDLSLANGNNYNIRYFDMIYCLDHRSGKLINNYKLFAQFVVYREVLPGIIMRNNESELISNQVDFINSTNGKLLYSVRTCNAYISSADKLYSSNQIWMERCKIVGKHGYYLNPKYNLVKFDLQTGKTIWVTNKPIFAEWAYEDDTFVYLNGVLYKNFEYVKSTLAAVNKNNGVIKWMVNPLFENDGQLGLPDIQYNSKFVMVVTGKMYADNSKISVYRLSDGKLLFTRPNDIHEFWNKSTITFNKYILSVQKVSNKLLLLDSTTGKELIFPEKMPEVETYQSIHQTKSFAIIRCVNNVLKTISKSTLKTVWNFTKLNQVVYSDEKYVIISDGADTYLLDTKTGKELKYITFKK